MNKFISLCLILGLAGCHKTTPDPDYTSYACGKVISTRRLAISVPIAYSKELDRYYVSWPSSTVDTINNRETSVFCNLPDTYKVVGKVIKFDGSFARLYDTTGTPGLIKKTFKTEWANYLSIDKIY
ncbi:hypothetical protein EXU85_06950 [Spirosoma sp. KCTC 42546]|uniref:hypothetical protein n=1 Tax=Spirosoma sp. KCTC 42546 TaxID=2520506 RepID=UPI001157CAAE|nr:hypothetical protein [Spirosoma sp. KCTC 42546]QDK78352.1 hypothetical protein EXU85_06950 [Spirosoma sp. KCTC 42546]